jgi:hypothetical protein
LGRHILIWGYFYFRAVYQDLDIEDLIPEDHECFLIGSLVETDPCEKGGYQIETNQGGHARLAGMNSAMIQRSP